jgi:hypothetical protein
MLPGDLKQLAGVVETIHVVSGFRQKVGVPSLSAGDVEYPGSDGQPEQIYQTCCFLAIALGREELTVLQEIVGVECRLPPLG